MKTDLTLLGQFRMSNWVTLSVLADGGARFYCLIDPTGTFLGRVGPQVWQVTNEQTARYFARNFSIPEPELFIEHSPHFEFLGTPEVIFPGGYTWQTVVEGPQWPGAEE